jgi:hypothetical protein
MQEREIVDPKELLISLKKAIKDPENILTKGGTNPLTNTKHREALTALLISQVLNKSLQEKGENKKFEICKNNPDTDKLDGYLKYIEGDIEHYFELEQVMLTKEQFRDEGEPTSETDLSEMIIEKLKGKHKKYKGDMSNVILIIFLDIKGYTIPREIKEYLKNNHIFGYYIQVVLDETIDEKGIYKYVIMNINPFEEGHSRFTFEIDEDFRDFNINLQDD